MFASGRNFPSRPSIPASGPKTSVIHFGKSISNSGSRGTRANQGVIVRVMAVLLIYLARRAGQPSPAGAAYQTSSKPPSELTNHRWPGRRCGKARASFLRSAQPDEPSDLNEGRTECRKSRLARVFSPLWMVGVKGDGARSYVNRR